MIVVSALGALAACQKPRPVSAEEAAAGAPRKAVDALWMIELPPVTVLPPHAAPKRSPRARAHEATT
jgi:hypothetical protein